MIGLKRTQHEIGLGFIPMAMVLLAGIVVLAVGYTSGNRIALYAGVFITLGGVLTGFRQLVMRRER